MFMNSRMQEIKTICTDTINEDKTCTLMPFILDYFQTIRLKKQYCHFHLLVDDYCALVCPVVVPPFQQGALAEDPCPGAAGPYKYSPED